MTWMKFGYNLHIIFDRIAMNLHFLMNVNDHPCHHGAAGDHGCSRHGSYQKSRDATFCCLAHYYSSFDDHWNALNKTHILLFKQNFETRQYLARRLESLTKSHETWNDQTELNILGQAVCSNMNMTLGISSQVKQMKTKPPQLLLQSIRNI